MSDLADHSKPGQTSTSTLHKGDLKKSLDELSDNTDAIIDRLILGPDAATDSPPLTQGPNLSVKVIAPDGLPARAAEFTSLNDDAELVGLAEEMVGALTRDHPVTQQAAEPKSEAPLVAGEVLETGTDDLDVQPATETPQPELDGEALTLGSDDSADDESSATPAHAPGAIKPRPKNAVIPWIAAKTPPPAPAPSFRFGRMAMVGVVLGAVASVAWWTLGPENQPPMNTAAPPAASPLNAVGGPEARPLPQNHDGAARTITPTPAATETVQVSADTPEEADVARTTTVNDAPKVAAVTTPKPEKITAAEPTTVNDAPEVAAVTTPKPENGIAAAPTIAGNAISATAPAPALQNVEPPRLDVRQEPVYPERARKRGDRGVVTLRALVDETGRVVRVVVEEGIPGSELEARAIDATLRSVYHPGTEDGRPVKAWVTERFVFEP